MSVIKFVILEDRQKSLETTIDFLLNCKEYSWEKIYLFSAFVSDYGVKKVKKILLHPHLTENTEVVIAIGKKDHFNNPSDIQDLLNFIDPESTNIKTKPVRFICPTNNFHIKTYCFLGRRVKDDKEIGFSIIGSSNLTQRGLECEGELCISIHHLNLTKDFIYRLLNKYNSESNLWTPLKIKEYERQYNEEHSRKDQKEVLRRSQENSTPGNQDQQPIPNKPKGKFLKLSVTDDIALIAKGTNLVKGTEDINWFYFAHKTIEQAKVDFREGSLCLLLTENKIFQIVEIMPYLSDQKKTEGCFVRYRENVNYELSGDICKILEKEEYKKIKKAEEEYEKYIESNQYPELEYATLNMFENEVKKYLNRLEYENYKEWLKKGKNNMKLEIDELLKINDLESIKKKLKELKEAYLM